MKKMICVALILMLLLCGCGTESPATTETTWDGLHRAQIKGEDVTFEAWEQEGLPTEGCYYLTSDVALSQTVTLTGDLKLHLNGHIISGADGAVLGNFFVVPAGTAMTLYDVPEAEGAIISPRSYSGKPTVTSMIVVGGSFTMAGGTIDASEISLENVANGTGFYVQDGGVLDVVGGTVVGGFALCSTLDIPEVVVTDDEGVEIELEPMEIIGKGGSVYLAPGAVCNVSGGVIRNGNAGLGGNIFVDGNDEKSGVLNLTGGTIADGEALFHGGNVYSCGKVVLSGGELRSGGACLNGGNVYSERGTVDVQEGAYVYGGSSAKYKSGGVGGNFFIAKNGVLTMTGGMVTEGNTTGNPNNIHSNLRCDGRFVMNAGCITGRVSFSGTSSAHFSGTIDITSESWELNVEVGAQVVFGECAEGTTAMVFLRITHFDSKKHWNKGVVPVLQLEEGVNIDINTFFEVKPYDEKGTARTFILRQQGNSLYFVETTQPKEDK